MKEFADRPLRVPQEPLAWHLWRMTRWLLELRLVPPVRYGVLALDPPRCCLDC